jgi:putative component of membrane protein insertase Oxa1/YidC/SpoIIIJ protein YidD
MITVTYFNSPKYNVVTAPIKRLYRPKVKISYIISLFFLLLILQGIHILSIHILCSYSICYSKMWFTKLQLIFWCFDILVCSDFIFLLFIIIYQHYAPSYIRLRCCMRPSCSNYAKIATMKYGLFIALPMIVHRLYRCSPFMGVDFP